jgi:hypothetical protein
VVEAEVTTLKRRLANCEEALKQKVALLMEAGKGQVELRKALADKEAELVAAQRQTEKWRRNAEEVPTQSISGENYGLQKRTSGPYSVVMVYYDPILRRLVRRRNRWKRHLTA